MLASPHILIPFSDPEFKADPYPLYAEMRDQGPVCRSQLQDGTAVFVVSHYDAVLAALKDPRLIKNIHNARPGAARSVAQTIINASMLRSDPPQHTRLRALAHTAFTPRFVAQLRNRIQQIADGLVDAVQERGKMDLINEYAFPLPITVICEMLGVPSADSHRFRAWTSAMLASGTLSSETPQIGPEMMELIQYLRALIAERHKQPHSDLISELIRAREEGDQLSDIELLGTTLLLLVAGHETTVNLIGSGVLALLQDGGKQWEALRQRLDRAKESSGHGDSERKERSTVVEMVEELLRLANPVQVVNRYAAEELVIGEMTIPQGSHVTLVLAAANHDPAFAGAHADDIQPDRGGVSRHVAFGQGIHYCLGAPLARLEGEIAFLTLLRRLPRLRLALPPERLQWRPSFELRGLVSLPVIF